MKITHVSSADIRGGAARSTYRLHEALLRAGIDSTLYVLRKESDDPSVVQFYPPDRLLPRVHRASYRLFLRRTGFDRSGLRAWNSSYFSDDRAEHRSHVLAQLPTCDILHLHWVAGFVDYSYFFSHLPKGPIVWTLHDMNPFTGGCHFDGGCGRFTRSCGSCPQLIGNGITDFSHECWTRKNRVYQALRPGNLHLVAPSQWLAREVRRSSLLSSHPVTVIPYGLDTDVFQPRDSRVARDVLGLRQDSKVILFLVDWASEARKGLPQLVEALSAISDESKVCLVVLGNGRADLPPRLSKVRLEYVQSDRLLSIVYSAADVFVLPAIQDNLPNTILEALACGLPVVAFSTGGIPDLVRDGVEGRLVPCGNTTALRDALLHVLNNEDVRRSMSVNARSRAVQEYKLEIQAQRYFDLYRSLGPVQG
jgi:glycosyltransferase involved in cell wall biosynthesis